MGGCYVGKRAGACRFLSVAPVFCRLLLFARYSFIDVVNTVGLVTHGPPVHRGGSNGAPRDAMREHLHAS